MTTPASSTIRYESSVTIARLTDDVFARLTELDGYREWMPRTGLFGTSRQTSAGPVGKGTTFVDSSRLGRLAGEVVDFERPSRVAFSETMRILGRAMMQVRPRYNLTSSGTETVVHHVAETELYGVMRLMKPVVAWMTKTERNRVLRSLKRSLEE